MTRLLSWLEFLSLLTTAWPLWRTWQAVRRTALRSAYSWAVASAGLWLLAALAGTLEPQAGAWIWLGHVRLLAAAVVLGPLVAVLGARWPGARAWNLIVLSLLIVFALPVAEQWLLGRSLERHRIGWDVPRFIFYWVVAAVGLLNYVPTRFGMAALVLAAGVVAQTVAVGPWPVGSESVAVCSAASGLLASAAAWLAFLVRRRTVPPGIDGAWLSLRDGWGAVWALRVRDRWNAAAEHYEWPLRLGWRGFTPVAAGRPPTAEQLQAAQQQFGLLLRRFVEPDRSGLEG